MDRLWSLLCDTKRTEYYLMLYKSFSWVMNAIIVAVGLISSATSIANWKAWATHPFLWGSIVGIAQLLQVLNPLLPFSRQLITFRYAIPEIEKIAIDLEYHWFQSDNYSDDKINKLVKDFQDKSNDILSKYQGSNWIPHIERLERKACVQRDLYIKNYLLGGLDNGQREEESSSSATT